MKPALKILLKNFLSSQPQWPLLKSLFIMYISLTLNVLSIYETVDFCLLFKELCKLFMSLETWVEVQHENSLIFSSG